MNSRHEKKFWERIPTLALFAVFSIIFAMIVAGVIYMARVGQEARDTLQPVSAKAQQGERLAGKVVIACDNQEIVAQLRALGACEEAEAITTAAPVGPSDAQVAEVVERYLRDHPPAPGRSVTAAEVTAVVAKHLTEHPPEPGRPPTPEEISRAASTYIAARQDQFRGDKGESATGAQISAAVAAYCGTTPSPCAGPKGDRGEAVKGDKGDQGISVRELYFARNASGECRVYVVLADPAQGSQETTIDGPAGDPACDPVPSEPAPEPAPPTTSPSSPKLLPSGPA